VPNAIVNSDQRAIASSGPLRARGRFEDVDVRRIDDGRRLSDAVLL
jgi:hypothetical protein